MTNQSIDDAEKQIRKKRVDEAVGLCVMSGLSYDVEFYKFMQNYVSGKMSLEEIHEVIIKEAQSLSDNGMESLSETGS